MLYLSKYGCEDKGTNRHKALASIKRLNFDIDGNGNGTSETHVYSSSATSAEYKIYVQSDLIFTARLV